MKNVYHFASLLIICVFYLSCSTTSNKVDCRDRYCGEYDLQINEKYHGVTIGYDGTPYIDNTDTTIYVTLYVSKVSLDTVSVLFEMVVPFDEEAANQIRLQNKEIKKRNAESLCGPDEDTLKVPVPTYNGNRTIYGTYHGHVKGHKIFIDDGYRREGKEWDEEIRFDSVYLRNDTLRYKKTYKSYVYHNGAFQSSRNIVMHGIGVKKN